MLLDWSNIDTVLLDMDGTLLDLHFDNYFWLTHLPTRYAERFNLDPAVVTPQIHDRLMARRGTLKWYSTDFWSGEFGVDIIALKGEIKHLINERPQALEFLDTLAQKGKKPLLVTNADRKSIQLKFSQTAIAEHFEHVVSSQDYGYAKEQPEFWQALKSQINFNPTKALFIDDSEAVLNSAHRYGIAYLRSIAQPDSQQRSSRNSQFAAIENFQDLFSPARGG